MAPWVRVCIFAGVLALLAALNAAFGWSDALLGDGSLAALQTFASQNLAQAGCVYVLASVVGCSVLALPGVVFALAAGTVFGPLWGTLLCWTAMTVGACLSFAVGRFFLKDALKPRLARHQALNRLLFEGARCSDVYLLAVTRLVPLFPFNLQNYAYGITDVRFVPYAVFSALFMLPGTALYTVAAAGVFAQDGRALDFAVAGALLVVCLVAAALLKRSAALS